MRWIFGAAFAAAIIAATPVCAGEWRMVTAASTFGVYMDQSTLRGENLKTVWITMAFTETAFNADLSLQLVELNCEERTMSDLAMMAHLADGTRTYTRSSRKPPEHIVPDTMYEYVLKAACFNDYLVDVPLHFESAYDALNNWRKSRKRAAEQD